jgi:hypothetical protein
MDRYLPIGSGSPVQGLSIRVVVCQVKEISANLMDFVIIPLRAFRIVVLVQIVHGTIRLVTRTSA